MSHYAGLSNANLDFGMSAKIGKVRSRMGRRRVDRAANEIAGSASYRGLDVNSLAFVPIRTGIISPRLNIVLPELHPGAFFAGIRTALDVGLRVASTVGLQPRLIVMRNSPFGSTRRATYALLSREFGLEESQFSLFDPAGLMDTTISENDVWMATHWTTAHALDIASRLGRISPSRVLYLVQDYEAGFSAWSSEYALARSTLHTGFHLIVNSSPLALYLTSVENIAVRDELVFAPSLDMSRLEIAAAHRRVDSSKTRILFYGRPSKPRNLFRIGCSSLYRLSSRILANGHEVEFSSAGEAHPNIALDGAVLTSVGKLGWHEYFDVLARTDIVFSLQHSPHPSHPPLDAVCSGAIAVTNEMGGTRDGLHERLLVSRPDPDELANKLCLAVERARSGGLGGFDPSFIKNLGRELDDVVRVISAEIEL
ncbi:rhamnosyltransferase WsaF family glycosyltransferase [Rhodococcus sp. T7]|uniref:rhamnosyltransferase WsaF family glycosyltransferase n=1 Tax=Rhodococcus sp. T7 TaxID=627444 RepID=UPI00135B728A|nr:hypothetical protein [Rhodococcus sp. T7]KAF0963801.1 hypothetical protein MLGJGCBP_03068 [Rhodococcus sp. T7]